MENNQILEIQLCWGGDGFLGPYYRILATDNTHQMWWDPLLSDIKLTVPFWIYDMDNVEHRHDVFTGKTKSRLLNAYIVQYW